MAQENTASTAANRERNRIVKTACGFCYDNCGINVYVENDRIRRVEGMAEHPSNRGMICVKARQAVDLVYSEDRLKCPMRRSSGGWQRISWDEALDTIAGRLKHVLDTDGPTAYASLFGDVVGMSGHMGGELIHRFCDLLGTPNRFLPDQMCFKSGARAQIVTIGKFAQPDPENARCIIIWGHNPHASFPISVPRIQTALDAGARLIVIDPRRIPFARRADLHVQPRPGTDCALALAMLNVIVTENLCDNEVIDGWTMGFEDLAEHVGQYPPEWAEGITGISADDIRTIARSFATIKPSCVIIGATSLDQQRSGFHTIRAITILQVITGNLDVPGGWVRVSGKLRLKPIRPEEKVRSIPFIGADAYPLMNEAGGRVYGEPQAVDWPNLVLEGKPYPLKMMIISGSNPVVTWPNSPRVREALQKIEFLAVHDIFMSKTAEMADIVLPACTFLERTEICDLYAAQTRTPYAMLRKAVIDPLWESWPDWKFWTALAHRMGYGEYFPWRSAEEALDEFLEPAGLTVDKLTNEIPQGLISGSVHYGEFRKRPVRTPSGKIEIYSETLSRLGYDPLPTYHENPETPLSAPDVAGEYPLILTTGSRLLEFWHSQHRHLPGLKERNPEPRADIHPDTAVRYGVVDEEMVDVETPRGKITVKARVNDGIMPGVVDVSHAWPQATVNMLTDNAPGDPISGYPIFKGLLCRVRRSSGA